MKRPLRTNFNSNSYHQKDSYFKEILFFKELYANKDNLYEHLFTGYLEYYKRFKQLLDEHKKSKYLKYKTKYLKLKKELNII